MTSSPTLTVLTGIKPTGSPHLGNFLGAIRPALKMAEQPGHKSFFFIADYHALSSIQNPQELRRLCREVAATWMAFGLNPEKITFYRQSDIIEIPELNWILSCFTPKGLMNRAHAYKACVAKNQESGATDLDAGISMGLYSYPILMAADILIFSADLVPVGKDQVQHVEISRDIAGKFNQIYGSILKLPQYKIEDNTAVLPGLDGRKMSKSYDNTIPLFLEPKKLQKLINSITTDSTPPEASKDPETSSLFQIYQEFATPAQIAEMKLKYSQGISWGQVKKELFEVLNAFLEKPRSTYDRLMTNPDEIDQILEQGAKKARALSTPFLKLIRNKIGMS